MKIQTLPQWGHLSSQGAMMGCAIVVGFSLPPAGVAFFSIFLVMRLCWIEDNLYSDLIYAKTLPVGYKNTQIRRARFFHGLGIHLDIETCPRRMASHLRRQSWILQGLFFGLVAGAITALGGVYLLVGLALTWHGMSRLEHNTVGLSWLENRQALPFLLVAGRAWWLPAISCVGPLRKPDHWQD